MKRIYAQSQAQMQIAPAPVQRLALSDSAPASPWIGDTTPFFGICQDGNLMSLHYGGGNMGILDLFDWQVTDVYLKEMQFLSWVRPAMTGGPGGGTATAGYLADPCTDPNGFEYGTFDLTISGFGRYGRMGPVREFLNPKRYCEQQPRVRIDGSLVTDEREWDLAFAMDVVRQDLFRDVITGNAATPGQFDGLQQWINTYAEGFGQLDSLVVDWNGNSMDGSGGGAMTVNAAAIAAGTDLVNVLLAIYRRIKQRIKLTPMLAGQELREGQVVLALPSFLAECLLDKYTCWSVCAGRQYNEVNLQTYEARQFRDRLNGGLFGAGTIMLDGDPIHLYPWDWETMHGSNRGDIYFLVRGVGNQRVWQGELLSAQVAAAELRAEGHNEYFVTDDGRMLGTVKVDNLCRQRKVWIRPRLYTTAPFLQARIMDVECGTLLDPLSPDPLNTSFFPVTSFAPSRRTVA